MKVLQTILIYSLRFLVVLVTFTIFVSSQSNSFTVQIASAPSESEAQTIAADLKAKGLDAYCVKAEVPGKGIRYRVRIGRYNNQTDAKAAGERARNRGLIKEFIVTNYNSLPAGTPQPSESKNKPPVPAKPKQSDRSDQAKMERLLLAKGESLARESLRTEANGMMTPPAPNKGRELTVSPIAKPPVIKEPPKSERVKSTANNQKNQPDLADNNNAPISEPEPNIATPPVADALADFSINNDNWKLVRNTTETDKNLQAVFFVDSMTGWAAGDAGAVYRTTDGGRNWKPLLSSASANINFIFFVDWNNGWMLGSIAGRGAARNDGDGETNLFTTTNGGRSWTHKPLPNVLKLYFIDAKNGWAVGKDATLLKTTDGGGEWKQVEGVDKLIGLPVESSTYNFGFCDVYFLDSDNGWALANFYGRARSNIGGLFVTSDGGNSWKRIPLTLQTQYSSGRFTPGELHAVHFIDANTGSVTGEMFDGEGRFFFALHTRDGGKTWEQFRTPSIATHSTQFLDLSFGWTAASARREGGAEAIVYDTTLMRTDNGGMSWQNDFIARGRRVRGVFFLSPTKGWAVGDRGMILRYEEKSKGN